MDRENSPRIVFRREALTALVVLLLAAALISAVLVTAHQEHAKPAPPTVSKQSEWNAPVPTSRPTVSEQPEWIAPVPTTRPIELTLQQLGDFQFDRERGGEIPERIKQLEGSTVRLKGHMWPRSEHWERFGLATADYNPEGNEILPQQIVIVICPPGKSAGYCPGEVNVEGRLHLHTTRDDEDGKIISLFQLFTSSVKQAQ